MSRTPLSQDLVPSTEGVAEDSDYSGRRKHGNGPSKLGRKGDPRMHRAVAARLANPEITLLDALRVGGFDFPPDCTKADDSSLLDKDNVTLGQRKNQLSRRCRLAKQATDARQKRKTTDSSSDNEGECSSRTSITLADTISPAAQAEIQRLLQHSSQSQRHGSRKLKRSSSNLSMPPAETEATDQTDNVDMQDEMDDMERRMAKFHPQFHPNFVPPTNTAAAVRGVTGTATSTSVWNSNPVVWPNAQPTPLYNNVAMASRKLATGVGGNNGLSYLPNMNPLQNHPSGVAVASLNATAASVGLSLEQLAVALSSSSQLMNVLNSPSSPEVKQQVALSLFQSESAALYQRCMLLAGYDANEAQESSSSYWRFAIKAWQLEGKRLQESAVGNTTSEEQEVDNGRSGVSRYTPERHLATATSEQYDAHAHAHGHAHAHAHRHSDDANTNAEGRHVHDVDGKCGHRAIIHQPQDGPAHVDFVVGQKVECYQGLKPVWRSRYNCTQLSCPTKQAPCPHGCEEDECDHLDKFDPKEFDLNSINLDGKEWNTDFFSGHVDDTLLGLIKLGGTDENK